MTTIPVAARRVRQAGLLSVLLLPLCASAVAQQAVPYGTALEKHFGATNAGPDWNQMTGSQIKILDFEEALKEQTRKMAQTPSPPAPTRSTVEEKTADWTVGCLLTGGLAGGVIILLLKVKFDTQDKAAEKVFEGKLKQLETDGALEAFFAELRNGLEGTAALFSDTSLMLREARTVSREEFFASAADRFGNLRKLVIELGHATEDAERKHILSELCQKTWELKTGSRIPALQPLWMLAGALEALFRQLSRESSSVNASAQRTAAGAVDLLQALCVPDLNPDLAINPPVGILAVDDDAISRRAISFALKKAFDRTTVASLAKTALDLATAKAYDVIFLDVEMPDMDGFELCTKIRETIVNKTTPIVFVTRHSDFDSRAKSSLSGGQDLIAKPYLSFEITVKALTLILGNRLGVGVTPRQPAAFVAKALAANASPSPTKETEPAAASPVSRPLKQDQGSKPRDAGWRMVEPKTETTTQDAAVSKDSAGQAAQRHSPVFSKGQTERLPDTFSAWSPVYLETLREQLQAAMLCTVPDHLQELITGFYLAVHSFSVESERAAEPTIHRLSCALEGMFKKLMEKPSFRTPSVWTSALTALELLIDLPCKAGKQFDLNNPPPRLLVVDDDPVARRAISGAIQLVFGKPENAGDGEAALEMASGKAFDLIFLDILMPGMDGFATCSNIRETGLNRKTPIVYISNHDDAESREKAAMSGGCGFVPKPVFSSQITLIALTSILRSRLNRSEEDFIVVTEREAACV